MKKAVFSNGFVDTYKGNRDVKAAWMIFDIASGKKIASGHSLTKEAAEKTSGSHFNYMLPYARFTSFDAKLYLKHKMKEWNCSAYEAKQRTLALRAEKEKTIGIEIVEL